MKQVYDPTLKANVTLDDAGHVRGINHLDEYREMEHLRGREAAVAYVRDIAGKLSIAPRCAAQPRAGGVVSRSAGKGRRVPLQRRERPRSTRPLTLTTRPISTRRSGRQVSPPRSSRRRLVSSPRPTPVNMASTRRCHRLRRSSATAACSRPAKRSMASLRDPRRSEPRRPASLPPDLLADVLGKAAKASKGHDKDRPPHG